MKPIEDFYRTGGKAKPNTRRRACKPCYSGRLQKSDAYKRVMERRNEGARKRYVLECEQCGGEWSTYNSQGRFCSMACYGESMRGEGPASRPHISQTVRREVYDRDRWRCQLCGDRVGRKLPPDHPRRASLDHIIPVSVGGADVAENLQLAHLSCNVAKSNGVWGDGEQLRLVG